MKRLLCWLFGHVPPPSPVDRIARLMADGRAPCWRCGVIVDLEDC